MATHIVTIVDTAFLGHLGETALGGAGNAVILFLIFMLAGSGLSTGTQIIIGRKNGEKRYQEIGVFFRQSILAALGMGTAALAISLLLFPWMLPKLIRSSDILEFINQYIEMRSWGVYFNFINGLFIAFYIGTTRTLIISKLTPIIALINVVLDYGLIYGKLGLPEMGVAGAALASNISEAAGTTLFALITFNKQNVEKYALHFRFKFRPEIQKILWTVSGPVILQNLISVVSWFTFFLLVEKMGERPLATSHIIRSIYVFLMLPVFAIGNTTNSLVSNLIGMNQFEQVKPLLIKMMLIGTAFNLLLTPFMIGFSGPILGIFTTDLTLVEFSVKTLHVVTATMYMLTIGMVMFSAVSGTGKTKVALLIELINIAFYVTYLYTATQIWKVEVHQLWFSEFMYFGGLTFLSLAFFKFYPWRKKLF